MTLQAAFEELNAQLQTLWDEVAGLRTAIREDKPVAGDVVLVDIFGDAVDDMLGWLEEVRSAAHEGEQAITQQADLSSVWRTLTICQEQLDRLQYRYFDLVSYNRLDPLIRFGDEQGGEWRAWVHSVIHLLERCQQPMYDVKQSLLRCWQEVAERAGTTSVSVQATNIGQQIAVPADWDAARAGVP